MTMPLLLERHIFRDVHLKSHLDRKHQEPGASLDYDVNVEVRTGQNPQDGKRWMVDLNIAVDPKNPEVQSYSIKLGVMGFFLVGENLKMNPEQVEKMVAVNGASILYSSAREYLLLISGRGPFPPVYLPTFNFLGLEKPEGKAADTGKPYQRATSGKK